jgi:hypothetical protein
MLTPFGPRRVWACQLFGSALVLFSLLVPPGFAQMTPVGGMIDIGGMRNSFPGRRIGGGTRGECWSRLFAHLLPANSIFTLGSPRLIGFLEGPAPNPQPLRLELRSLLLLPDGRSSISKEPLLRREFSPLSYGITLILLPKLSNPVVWSSTYVCPEAEKSSDDPLANIVTSGEPSPISLLLLSSATAEEKKSQQALQSLYKLCGKTVPRQELGRLFGFSDLEADYWPKDLPIRCP